MATITLVGTWRCYSETGEPMLTNGRDYLFPSRFEREEALASLRSLRSALNEALNLLDPPAIETAEDRERMAEHRRKAEEGSALNDEIQSQRR